MSSEIVIPFQLNKAGGVATTSSDDAKTRMHFLSLLNTEPGERAVLPQYGVPLSSLLFEQDNGFLRDEIYNDIKKAQGIWEPGIRVDKPTSVASNTAGDGLVLLNLTYARVDSPADTGAKSRHSNTVTIGPGGVLGQTIRG